MMKENLLDVLMYLFENYLDDETEIQPDRELLRIELEEAGFDRGEVNKAFNWLEGLAADPATGLQRHATSSIRVFASEELLRIDTESRGFLLYLEQIGILSQQNREIVIDRIMALDSDEIDIDQVKWIILMVLFNQPGQEQAYARMEDLVFEEGVGAVH
jgi:Smg protein